MGYAKHVGRVGALALVLGVGMAAPAVCAADATETGSSSSDNTGAQSESTTDTSVSEDSQESRAGDATEQADGDDSTDPEEPGATEGSGVTEDSTELDDELDDELANLDTEDSDEVADDDRGVDDAEDHLQSDLDPDDPAEADISPAAGSERHAPAHSRRNRALPQAAPAAPAPRTEPAVDDDQDPSAGLDVGATARPAPEADSAGLDDADGLADQGLPEQPALPAQEASEPAPQAPVDSADPLTVNVALAALGGLPGEPGTPVGSPLFELMAATYRRSAQKDADEAAAPIGASTNALSVSTELLDPAGPATASSDAAGASVDYTVTSDWGSGYVATVTVTAGDSDIDGWTVEFDSPAQITNLWSGTVVSADGDHYVVENAAWNGTVAAGQSVTFGFQAVGDSSTTTGFTLNGQATTDPDPDPEPSTPTISVANTSAAENSGTLDFTVTLSEATTDTITVDYTTTDGTALAGTDYTATTGTLTFTPGQTSQTITVTVLDDTDVETTETLTLTLASPTGATLADPTATGTITNDDVQAPPSDGDASVDYTVTSDWGSGYVATVTVTAGDSDIDGWTVEFDSPAQITNLWSGTVVSADGDHYVVENAAWNGTVAAGQSVTFGFQAVGDSSATTGFTLNGQATTDPDPDPEPSTPTISVANTSAAENNGTLDFTVTLSEATTDTITVDYTTTDGTALAGTDYTATTGTLTFTPGQTSQTITVTLLDDTIDESTESVMLTLSDPTGATLADDTATGAIVDDDGTAAEAGWPDAVYSPFVDMGLYPPADLVEISQTYGVSFVNLGFMQADSEGNLAWAGLTALEPDSDHEQAVAINESIAQFQASGGKVAISMGGVANTTIAEVYAAEGRSAEELAAQYQTVIDAYDVDRLDFDIESSAQYDEESIALRSEALAIVQENNPDVEIWYTLPVLPSGLTDAGLNVVESALEAGVELDGVNVMAMDYGESAAPTTGPDAHTMGEYAVQAGESTHDQLATLYSEYGQVYTYDQLGITVMIGVNDITTEVFTTEDAQTLLDYANESGLGMISIWSITRDNPGTIGQPTNYASGTDAESGAYSDIFNDYGAEGDASALM